MEVSNVRDHVTHAIISGGKTIDFGISDSPEFFHILSSTLYSDQPLAVVREVLCNAWDAHIEAGCTDKPVQITLTDDELIIRDFGKGISDDDIGPIYGVYGASTKKLNQQVTGGFGLGCKAPFAYTDHFEVTSWHAGRKTIYNMSKSSAEVNGRPGIVPIASFPTDETGLQVKIQLKMSHDKHRFAQLIRRIASNGEMNAHLNDEPIEVLPFSTMKNGFMVTSLPVIEQDNQNVLIRYGHVIYPVESHPEYRSEFKKIECFLEGLPSGRFDEHRIIFQAAPDSISVTPSRESLSMQEHTIKTITGIFQDFADLLDRRLEPECLNVLNESIVSVWTKMRPTELFSTEKTVPGLYQRDYTRRVDSDVMVELPKIVRAHVSANYPEYRNFRFKDLLARLDSLIQSKFGNTGLINSFRSELIRLHRRKELHKTDSTWLHRKVLGPLFLELKAAGLNPKKLQVYGTVADHYWGENLRFVEPAKYHRRQHEKLLPFLRNIVVLTHNQMDVMDRVPNFPIMKNWLGKSRDFICYTVPRSPKKVELARKFFEDRGFVFLDLTVYHKWEEAPKPVAVTAKEKPKPRPKGLPILSTLLNGGQIRVDFLWYDDETYDIRRTETPKIVVKLPRRENSIGCIGSFAPEETQSICALWANDIGVAITGTQLRKYLEAGAVELNDWVLQQVCAEIQTNTRIHQAIASDVCRIDAFSYRHNLRDIFDVIWSVPELRKEFGLTNDLTEADRHYLRLWRHIEQLYCCTHIPEVKKTSDITKKIPLDPAVIKLSKLLETRRDYVELIKSTDVRRILLTQATPKDSSKLKPVIETTKQIVLLALKG